MNKRNISCMTENELRVEAARLRELRKRGEITPAQAEQLDTVERALRRIHSAGRRW